MDVIEVGLSISLGGQEYLALGGLVDPLLVAIV
jgi:hypothetical protein